MLGYTLGIFVILCGIGIMFGGAKTGKKILVAPFKHAGNLALELLLGVTNFVFELLGSGLRWLFRLIGRGFRRLFRLGPQPPPLTRHTAHHEEDEHEAHEGDHH